MSAAARQTWQVSLRYLRVFARQPAYLGITLTQPLIWLLLFGALFKAVTEIPGFNGDSYIDFLTPGVVVMLAVSSAGWTGMGFIEDINAGVMDRMLASPVWRGALNLGSVVQSVVTVSIQTALILLLALVLGAHYTNGIGGVLIQSGARSVCISAEDRNVSGSSTRLTAPISVSRWRASTPMPFDSDANAAPSSAATRIRISTPPTPFV